MHWLVIFARKSRYSLRMDASMLTMMKEYRAEYHPILPHGGCDETVVSPNRRSKAALQSHLGREAPEFLSSYRTFTLTQNILTSLYEQSETRGS